MSIASKFRNLSSVEGMLSKLNYFRLRRSGRNAAHGGKPIGMRVKKLNGKAVYCRLGTTDFNVFYDTFIEGYHVARLESAPRSILDLGSNIGLTMAHYCEMYPDAQVIGVELDGGNCEIARMNTRCYGSKAHIIHGAVWTDDGTVHYGGSEEWAFQVSGDDAVADPGDLKSVAAYTVDSIMKSCAIDAVDFVKMDIEGAEKRVLENGEKWLSRIRCIKVEIHAPYTVDECMATLRSFGLLCERDAHHPFAITGRNP